VYSITFVHKTQCGDNSRAFMSGRWRLTVAGTVATYR